MQKIVTIFSGGMDSTTLLYHFVKDYTTVNEVLAISFDYGQRHNRELACARQIAQQLDVGHQVVDLSDIKYLLAGSGSSQVSDRPVPHGHYAEENMKQTVVPNRNMMMISISIAYALAQDAIAVGYGCHAGDHTIYPDCRLEFVHALREAARLCDWKVVEIWTPFVKKTKADIVKLGLKLGVDYKQTHTCYEGEPVACGRCGTCVERLEAFDEAGEEDPLEYKDRDYWRSVCAAAKETKAASS